MIKTFKKAIAIMLTLVFVLSLVPVSGLAEEGESSSRTVLYMKNYISTRSGTYADSYQTDVKEYSRARTRKTTGNNLRYAFAQIDFSGYEEILDNDSTSLILSIKTSTKGATDFRIGAISDGGDKYDWTTLTHNIADGLGMLNASDFVELYRRSDATTVTDGRIFSDGIAVSDILSKLNTGYDNSVLTFRFEGLSSNETYYSAASNASNIEIIYNEKDIDNKAYVESVAQKLTWGVLSSDDADIVSNNLNLPKKFYGVDIKWTSSDEDVVSSSSGEILTKSTTPVPVTLKANLTYTNALGERAILEEALTFDFIARLPVDAAEGYIPFSNGAVTRNDNDNSYGCMTPNHEDYTDYRYLRTGGIWASFAQLDFTGYEEILKNPGTSAVMSFNSPYMGSSANHYARNFNIYLSADSNDGYNGEELSYDDATDVYNLTDTDNRPILYTRSDAAYRGTFSEEVDINTLASVLDEGTDNSLVTMYLKSISGDTYIRVNTEDTGLYLTYDKNEINNEAYLTEVKDALTWNVLSKGAQDKVSADLYLPTKFKGADIVWETDGTIIKSSGEVDFENNKSAKVTIKAKMSYTNILNETVTDEKTFELTISDGTCDIGTPTLVKEADKFTASWAIDNYSGSDITYYVYLAAYSNGELVGLTPVTYVAKNGMPTSINPTVECKEGYTAKLIIIEDDKLTPYYKALEK